MEHSVDVIVSEPLGTMLFNERMLETYVIARDKFLKPGGKMYPSQAYLCIAPFYDEGLYNEQLGKASFWASTNFSGYDLSILYPQAVGEKFRQPIIEAYNPKNQYKNDLTSP
jgi:histone-arginine methyltransferase CARM1